MQQVAEWLRAAEHTVIFTGAGMSTESGLPDFRSKDRGLWEKFNPDELANVDALLNNTEEFVDFYRFRLREVNKYTPHAGHHTLAKWERQGLIDGIITQNVDGFHTDAGNETVHELHGTFRRFHCHECGKTYERDAYLDGHVTCTCGGTIRPGIVLFGETLPQTTFSAAEQLTMKADLFIVLGSSLSVTPANMFPAVAKQNGAKLVIINREPTVMDYMADRCIHGQNIKHVLNEIDALLENSK
ncbi:NAD-dependent protein deacetylase [Lentibacillus sp. JNUCC-1]|uniref:SIR2 family NAD-dependent protein deacylase n=1 Tax=Lentibacillus sp. JNUCC-1 TaxID=2654513 RepID=UPI0012E821B0|nr:NAD-dependent deacylase [Lentibacillus sp. JNUCC-1]MUV37529.1 NAD-dependent protein deacetylase [Lentibacillus sp. JNUCC-1]